MKGAIVAALTLPCLIATGTAAYSQVPGEAGLRLETDEITTTFQGYLAQFGGDCPGSEWSGPAASDDIRFISLSTPPAENLKVQLTSQTTGESLEKAYEQESKGSSDFSLQKLGEADGTHVIEYLIFDEETESILEEGSFTYTVTTSQTALYDSAHWPESHYCHDVASSYTHFGAIGFAGVGLYYWPYFGGHHGRRLRHRHYLKHKHFLKGKHLKEKQHFKSHFKQHEHLPHKPTQAKKRRDTHKTPPSKMRQQQVHSPHSTRKALSPQPAKPRPQKKAVEVKQPEVVKSRPKTTQQSQRKPSRTQAPPPIKPTERQERKTIAPRKTEQKNQPSPQRIKPAQKATPIKKRKIVRTAPRKAIKTKTVKKKQTPLQQRRSRLQRKRGVRQPSRTSTRSRQYRQKRAVYRAAPRQIQRRSRRRVRPQSRRRASRRTRRPIRR